MVHQELGFQQSCKARVVLCHWPLWVRLGSRLPVNLSFYLGAPEVEHMVRNSVRSSMQLSSSSEASVHQTCIGVQRAERELSPDPPWVGAPSSLH